MIVPASSQSGVQTGGFRYWLQNRLHGGERLMTLLVPLAWIYTAVISLRRIAYEKNWLKSTRVPVPVIVVGNISVGGTGKSPIVRTIVDDLTRRGFRPGIVARGYRGKSDHWPRHVDIDSDPGEVGDEAVEHAILSSAVGVTVGPSRTAAATALINHSDCNIIVADDGLQHLALRRDVEVAVIDGEAGFGNGRCLPAGPLREPVSVLGRMDHVIVNGPSKSNYASSFDVPCWSSRIQAGMIASADGQQRHISIEELNSTRSVSISAIGNPERFETMLRSMGLKIVASYRFSDHHEFQPQDFEEHDGVQFVMTLKDAVKCRRWLARYPEIASRSWYVGVHARLDADFLDSVASHAAANCKTSNVR